MRVSLVSLLLVCIATATPVALNSLTSNAQILSASNETVLHVDVSPPWIAEDFKLLRSKPYEPFEREDCFMFALNLIGQQALHNFNGSLETPTTTFRDPDYPDMELIATSYESEMPLPRRFFLWGMASIMAFMEVKADFSARVFGLVWKETIVGLIRWNKVSASDHFNTATFPSIEDRQLNRTTVTVGDDQLSWAYEFDGALLTMTDVFMSTFAALVQAAELGNYIVDSFVASWPPTDRWPSIGYPVEHHWVTRVRPSAFTKDILIESILAAAKFAHHETNYHELRVGVTYKHELIAWGGYNKTTIAGSPSVSEA